MPTDAELLRCYADEKSEPAFGELVRRHVNLVYAVARRQCGGDAQLAEDVTQRVFTDLARKARQLSGYAVLGGWLFRSAQFAASDVVRAERRRRTREAEAQTMHHNSLPTIGDTDWQTLAPVLDQVIGELAERDRDAVVLRFFEGRPFAEIGATLRLSEDAARMRVERALDKLHAALAKRGVNSTAAALGLALGSQAVAASAPAGLAASVTGAALAGAGTAAGGAMVFMGTIKLQVGITAALVVAGTAGFVMQSRADAALREEITGLRGANSAQVMGALREENRRLWAAVAEVETLRKDDAELARLRDEAAAVRTRQQQAAQAVVDARAKRAAEIAAMPVYAEAQVDEQPKAKFQGGIRIPKALRDMGGRGEARISYVVNADGEVSDVQALSSTHPEWAEAAVAAVKQWQFEPARRDGAAVNMRKETPMVFTNETKATSEKGLGRRFWF